MCETPPPVSVLCVLVLVQSQLVGRVLVHVHTELSLLAQPEQVGFGQVANHAGTLAVNLFDFSLCVDDQDGVLSSALAC